MAARPTAPPTMPTPADADALAEEWEPLSAEEVVDRAVRLFHPDLRTACSFQKEESVLVDILGRVADDPRLFTIDTGALFAETLRTWRAFEDRFGVRVEAVEALPGDGRPWTADRCCGNRKVDALERALAGATAWMTGIRRVQSATRSGARKIEWDAGRGMWKVNPLADWSDDELWARISERDLPYNPLHDRGYDSIGCAPCTQPGAGREGRWAGQDKTECGLHTEP